VVVKDMHAQVCNSFKDNHFTVLGFTAADGRAIMCVTDVMGFNPLSKDADDVSSDDMKLLEDEIEQIKDEHSTAIRMLPQRADCDALLPLCSCIIALSYYVRHLEV
jgi:hypothetical protein